MENIGIKNEFYTPFGTVPCCHACLCTDRMLSSMTEYIDIYRKICDEDDHNLISPMEKFLCWECTALLKRLRNFKKRAAEAQQILQLYHNIKQGPFPPSLSNLSTHATIKEINITYKEEDIKEIKLEDQYEDEFDHFDYADDIKDEPKETSNITDFNDMNIIENIVTPNPDVPKPSKPSKSSKLEEFNMKKLLKRNAKYRFINVKLKKHRQFLVRKLPVKLNEVLTGLKEERCYAEFVKAPYKCGDCVAVLDNQDGLEKHNKKGHDPSIGPHQCAICHVRCSSEDKLQAHEAKHYFLRECKVCRVQSYSQHVMDRHLEMHHRMVQCIACELCFKNARLFYIHYKALHGVFVCDVCGKRCKSRSIIEKHLRSHFGYECPYCKKKLKNSSSYKNHIETQHASSVSENSYCVPCDRRFNSCRMYKRHLQGSAAHARERDNTRAKRKYPCPECSNVYSRRTYMNNHYRHVHTKQSKYYCGDCDRHFLNRTRFLDHRRFQHEGLKKDKDKLCNICGRGFAANRTLINHIRTHSGERPFGCEYCGAKFTQKHAMLSHVKYIHLKSKRKASWHE